MFYVDVIKMEISCLSAGKSCEVQDLCASFRACAACRQYNGEIFRKYVAPVLNSEISGVEIPASDPAFVYIEEMIRLSSQEPQYYEIRVRTQLEEFWCRLLDKITAVQIEPSSHREDSARIKEMLTSTTRTITEISEMCGFSSLSYFGKVFRQHTGVTPVQYRSGL